MTDNAARRRAGVSRIGSGAALWLAGSGLAAALVIAIFVR